MNNTKKILEEFDEKFPNLGSTDPKEGWYDAKPEVKAFLSTSITQARAEEWERMRGWIENAIKYTNWSHPVGSHSDDRGGDSDIKCTYREDAAKYKTEAYKNILSSLNTICNIT